jgi:hypothetical protein
MSVEKLTREPDQIEREDVKLDRFHLGNTRCVEQTTGCN